MNKIHPLRAFLLSVIGLLSVGTCLAQTVSIEPLSGTASTVRTATYTVPAGGSCTASGAWSATKTASGTATFNVINSGTLTWTCSLTTGSANLSWSAPTTNTDGSVLTKLNRYDVYSGTVSTNIDTWYGNVIAPDVAVTYNTLPLGNRCFGVKAVVDIGATSVWSEMSPVVCKVIVADTVSASVDLVVTTPIPSAPTSFKVL